MFRLVLHWSCSTEKGPLVAGMKIYLAANYYSHPLMRSVAERLRAVGHAVDCEWIKGIHQGDDHETYACIDLTDIDKAECLVLFTQDFEGSRTRGGKHVEFGYALAKGHRMIIVGERKNVFHHLENVESYPDVEALIAGLQSANAVNPQPANDPPAERQTKIK